MLFSAQQDENLEPNEKCMALTKGGIKRSIMRAISEVDPALDATDLRQFAEDASQFFAPRSPGFSPIRAVRVLIDVHFAGNHKLEDISQAIIKLRHRKLESMTRKQRRDVSRALRMNRQQNNTEALFW